MSKELNCMNCSIGDFKHELCDSDNGFCKEFKSIGTQEDFFNAVIQRIRPVWIPVSERLPEYVVDMWDEGVIATVNGREGNIIYENGIVPDAWFEDGKWYVNDAELENAKVVAWMPLPEPYKADTRGDTE